MRGEREREKERKRERERRGSGGESKREAQESVKSSKKGGEKIIVGSEEK